MKISELVNNLNKAIEECGDIEVVGIADGEIFEELDMNCPDDESPLYLELYHKEDE